MEDVTEIWLPITGIEGYEVSNLGRFKSLYKKENGQRRDCFRKEKIMKNTMESNGYYQVRIDNVAMLTHRLVAKTFLPSIPSKNFVNHKNGIKTDNRVENLEWVTKSENSIHAYQTGLTVHLTGLNHPFVKVDSELSLEIKKKYIPRKYSSIRLAKEYNLSKTTILNIINNKHWTNK